MEPSGTPWSDCSVRFPTRQFTPDSTAAHLRAAEWVILAAGTSVRRAGAERGDGDGDGAWHRGGGERDAQELEGIKAMTSSEAVAEERYSTQMKRCFLIPWVQMKRLFVVVRSRQVIPFAFQNPSAHQVSQP